jgi:membrane protease YdiL (CAAX protease family)
LAIAVTTTMDANGLTEFSAFPLLALTLVFWGITRLPLACVGLMWGKWADYGLALFYPLAVLAIAAAIAVAAGAAHLAAVDARTLLKILVVAVAGAPAALLTEEGFFRGWLWGSLRSANATPMMTLLVTSIVFAAWHISYATLAHGFQLPPMQVLIFIANAAVIGAIWGLMRLRSGSIVVTSVSHGLWNAIAYLLFGEGPKIGALGVANTATFGPEVGVVGLALNVAFACGLFCFTMRSQSANDSRQHLGRRTT